MKLIDKFVTYYLQYHDIHLHEWQMIRSAVTQLTLVIVVSIGVLIAIELIKLDINANQYWADHAQVVERQALPE